VSIRTAIITRAVPGSGKTSMTNCIVEYLLKRGVTVAVHSTDQYFMTKDGKYDFDISRLYENHALNLANFSKSLEQRVQVVICDNINLSPWQTEPYTTVCRNYGYNILFITLSPRALIQHVQSQQISAEKPDAHGVPEEVLVRFILEYMDYDALLDKSNAVDPDIHRNYEWDISTHQRVESKNACKHFDLDKLITIRPNEYHERKPTIGSIVHNYIMELGDNT